MNRILETETIEGELSIIIHYLPQQTEVKDVLSCAIKLIDALEVLDSTLLSNSTSLPHQKVIIQTEYGDTELPDYNETIQFNETIPNAQYQHINKGIEFFKVRSTDMLGKSQWGLLRNQKMIKVDMLDEHWLQEYHKREHIILPGDSLECHYEEMIDYDEKYNEIKRTLSIIKVIKIITPIKQLPLGL